MSDLSQDIMIGYATQIFVTNDIIVSNTESDVGTALAANTGCSFWFLLMLMLTLFFKDNDDEIR